jgi:hypothetical protein
LTGVNGTGSCYEGEHAGRPAGGSGIGPDGVLVIQRRDAVAGAFAVALAVDGLGAL